ncbi:MAG: hypothetical protein HYV09_41330 [Deltaproteobacteria bacterium]|nr:hypothetical protein [Deltaproteobacteria bacterium]
MRSRVVAAALALAVSSPLPARASLDSHASASLDSHASASLDSHASASLDPARAEADVRALREEGLDGYCRNPNTPLSPRAIGLCPHAREVKGCEGFVAACDALENVKPIEPPGWFKRFFEWIGPVAQLVLWALVAAVVVLLVLPLVRWWLRARRSTTEDAAEPKTATVEVVAAAEEALATTDAEALLARAADHERRGDLARAISTYLAAALRALDVRGAIRLERHRTNGEYVRGCAEAGARPPLGDIVREVDLAEFGGRPPDGEAVARVSRRAIALVRGLPLALLVMVLLLAGCADALSREGHDPAGDDLLRALLAKQGVTVSRAGPLASLPLPKEGETPPALVVDLARTQLDEDAEAHVLRWTRAGGTLVLMGGVERWPKALAAKRVATVSEKVEVTTWDEDEPQTWTASLVHRDAFTWKDGISFAHTGDGETWASSRELGAGRVVGVAGSELLTNAALARAGNAAALLGVFDAVGRDELRFARPEDGTSPPSNPFTALVRAGLGLGLGHALLATLLLFLAAGVRLARATPRPAPRRRAFAEHVEATGALWARARLSPHALSVFGRFVEERVRARRDRLGEHENALLARAQQARTDETPRGDELRTMKDLGELLNTEARSRLTTDD